MEGPSGVSDCLCHRTNDSLIKPVDPAHETAMYIPTMVE